MPDIVIEPVDGLNRVDPIQKMGNRQCRKLVNLLAKDNKLSQFRGTAKYNETLLPDKPVWSSTYYGIGGDGVFTKKRFCFSGNSLYLGNDTTKKFTLVQGGFSSNVKPESCTIQVSGQSRMFFFTGKDVPYYYDGNDAGTWYKSAITEKLSQGISWLDRLFAIRLNGSGLLFSKTLFPDDFTDSTDAGEILVGVGDDSIIKRIILFRDYIFIFKNDSIYYLEGRTPATFSPRIVTAKYGLASSSAICRLGNSIVFLNSSDNELYQFTGTEASIKMLSREIDFSDMINPYTIDDICCIEHNNLFRMSFRPKETESDTLFNSYEVVFPITELNEKGLPKWTTTKGANISHYSVWDKQGDNNQLVTCRSDAGCLMLHDRGYDWDDTVMEIEFISKDMIPNTKFNCIFESAYLDGKPGGNRNVTFKYYLNGNITAQTNMNYNVQGEVRTLGMVSISRQIRFNERILFLSDENRGNSIAAGLYANMKNLGLEFYSATIPYELDDILQ